MNPGEVFQLVFFLALVIALTPLVGGWMAKVFRGERQFLTPLLGWLERLIYRVARVDPAEEMTWKRYAGGLADFQFPRSVHAPRASRPARRGCRSIPPGSPMSTLAWR